ncbi:FK506-binding protein 5 isoform X2 [Drosophila hydei]|uniref:FK506-binding protein 5 isoform X2 n=1 Tax=Drosophila hydei TaxID=7224 RepID=A0A6J1LGH6_DROHY|nr:FK506-binding protein 5 isoform X2 [Drosophila hydei]
METTAAEIDGVLQHQESASHTPVAKKTRRALLQKQNDSISNRETVLEDDVLMALPKTPNASVRIVSDTPRRSARKSVRPTLDYTEIIEKNLLASASKEKRDTTIVDKEDEDEENTLKWSIALVGRTSTKRNRKVKKPKQQKRNEEPTEMKEEVKELEKQEESKLEEEKKQQEEDSNELEIAEAITVASPLNGNDQNTTQEFTEEINEKSFEATPVEIKLTLCPEIIEDGVRPDIVKEDEMDELGLCPLDADDQNEDEMPSLILMDDDEPGNELNVTFDASDNSNSDEVMPALCVMEEQQIGEDPMQSDYDRKCESTKPKAYRFPTPFKRKINTEFRDSASSSTNFLQEPFSSRLSRSISIPRSNETKGKGVTFYSPVEMANVNDIDKRWENLNNSNITKRRKRSKSLEVNPLPSRIPKINQYHPPNKSTITPNKSKLRSKLPNFAAIHQKQFEKMENLVEHLERKAVRAKVLTSSAVKLQQQEKNVSSAKKQIPVAERVRSRAVKKIEVPTYTLTPMKPEELERMKLLPTPRKIVGVAQPKANVPARPALSSNKKPAFNLSTSVTSKLFIPAASGARSQNRAREMPSNRDEPMQKKLEARRKRHMEMFKGRNGLEKRSEIVRGVRSNRRFELQMQHRRQLDENTR